MRKLTKKQRRFCELYADYTQPQYYGNGTQCALAVYDISPDADRENTAASIATELLQKPAIQDYIRELEAQQVAKIDENYIIKEIARLKTIAERRKNIPSALKALEMLGKWQALFTERREIQSQSFEDFIAEVENRRKEQAGKKEPIEEKA